MNKVKGMVSVILPTYNRENFIEDAIGEILDSSYKNLELIVVNDGSTDKTNEILSKIKNVKIINLEENSGTVSIPRNIGISHSIGEFIAHADDDVVTHKDKFLNLVEAIETNENNILSYGDRIDRYQNGFERLQVIKDWNPLNGTGVDNSQFIYKSNVYKDIGFCYVYRACDWELAKRIYPLGRFIHINSVVSIYLWHDDNRSIKTNGLYSTIEVNPETVSKFEKYVNKNYFNEFIS